VLSYHIDTAAARTITWLLTFLDLQQEVEANGTMDVWFNFPPTAYAIKLLNIIFKDHTPCKPTFYIKNFNRRGMTLKDSFGNLACLDKLSQDGYMVEEWDWRIFARLTHTQECSMYTKTSECPKNRRNKYMYFNRIGRSNIYAKLCNTTSA